MEERRPISTRLLGGVLAAVALGIVTVLVFASDDDDPELRASLERGAVTSTSIVLAPDLRVPSTIITLPTVPDFPDEPIVVPSIPVPRTVPVQPYPPQGPCPEGTPTASVQEFRATQPDPITSPNEWRITASGTVTNRSNAAVHISHVTVIIEGQPDTEATAFAEPQRLAPGESATWRLEASMHTSTKPSAGNATPHWSWTSFDHWSCPAG